jgi:N-acetylneuraminic acid mutarotase
MKRAGTYKILLIVFAVVGVSFSAEAYYGMGFLGKTPKPLWTWMTGVQTANQTGAYGTKGTGAASNSPGARVSPASWTDANGDFWMFGGRGYDGGGAYGQLNDLWTYKVATGQWVWISGKNTANGIGTYGTKGSGSTSTVPGSREGSMTWADSSGNLWLFGGYGYTTNATSGNLSDLWKFTISSGLWTWVGGPNSVEQPGSYGVKLVGGTGNIPGARDAGITWTDASGNLWLFGGEGKDISNLYGVMNDLWKFVPGSGQWTWMSGSSAISSPGTYGVKGSGTVSTVPGARAAGASSWSADAAGNLYLFGGFGVDSAGGGDNLNDVWRYNISTQIWTWLGGSNLILQNGVYGKRGVANAANIPGARSRSLSWVDTHGNMWLLGGENSSGFRRNDLWRYNFSSNQWTWFDGDQIEDSKAIYGAQGVLSQGNITEGRGFSASWIDASGKLWFFGGEGGNSNIKNDFWRIQLPP